jgi:hypothetical protein
MKSGGQIDRQIASQLPVFWWYPEVFGMRVEAVPVLGTEPVDFLFN